MKEVKDCDHRDLEKGNTLYWLNKWEGGYDFYRIRNIKYCPICGKELPGDDDDEE